MAFSLIELLIVIAIFIILVSLLSPSLQKIIATANTSECRVNLKQISVVNHIYADDYDNYFVPLHTRYNGRMTNWKTFMVATDLYPAMDTDRLCPTYTSNSSYGMNHTTHGGSWRNSIDRPINRQLLLSPAMKIQGGDCTSSITYIQRADPYQSRGWVNHGERGFRTLAYRHGEKANVFYFDGHIESFDLYSFSDSVDKFKYSSSAIKSNP